MQVLSRRTKNNPSASRCRQTAIVEGLARTVAATCPSRSKTSESLRWDLGDDRLGAKFRGIRRPAEGTSQEVTSSEGPDHPCLSTNCTAIVGAGAARVRPTPQGMLKPQLARGESAPQATRSTNIELSRKAPPSNAVSSQSWLTSRPLRTRRHLARAQGALKSTMAFAFRMPP